MMQTKNLSKNIDRFFLILLIVFLCVLLMVNYHAIDRASDKRFLINL